MASVNLTPLLLPRITPLAPSSLPGQAGTFTALLPALPLPATEASPTGAQPIPASPAASADINPTDVSSMRPDQLVMMRQLVWPQFNRATLVATWRAMVRARLDTLSHAGGQKLNGSLLMAGQLPGAQAASQQQMPWHPDAWRFVLSRPDQQITLRVLDGGADQQSRKRHRGKAALRVELILADGNSVMIQLEALEHGVIMQVAAANATTLDYVRTTLPQLREAITRAGFTLARVDVRHALAPARPLQSVPGFVSLPAPLFSAMADLVLLLTPA